MNRAELFSEIKRKKSFLCIGLDPDLTKIPKHLLKEEDPIFAFNKAIIDATKDFCIAYKPNIAFYECLGVAGWESLRKTLEYIPDNIFTIADAKRGDIGNTSKMYASTFFENLNFDSITVNPYMGRDSVVPYYDFKNKWVILLGLTSNEGAKDFQFLKLENNQSVFEQVIKKTSEWGTTDNTMYVVGATRGDLLKKIRDVIPNSFLLVPGVGSQGGSLEDVVENCWIEDCGLIVNSSRGIIYAGSGEDFAKRSEEEAIKLQSEMSKILFSKNII